MHNFCSCLAPFLLPFSYFSRQGFILLFLFYNFTKPILFFNFFYCSKILNKNNFGKEGFVWAESLKVRSTLAGKIKLQDQELAVHIVSVVRKQRRVSECCCPAHFLLPTPFVRVGLHSEFAFSPQVSLSGNILIDTPRKVPNVILNLVKMTMKINYHCQA